VTARKECGGLVVVQGQDGAKVGEGEVAVAEEKEEEEEHDDDLGDGAEGVAEDAGEPGADVGGCGLGGATGVDGG